MMGGLAELATFAGSLGLRATAVLLLALAGAALLRREGGSARHLLWTVTMAALVALPVLALVLPRLPVLPALAISSTTIAPSQAAAPDGRGDDDAAALQGPAALGRGADERADNAATAVESDGHRRGADDGLGAAARTAAGRRIGGRSAESSRLSSIVPMATGSLLIVWAVGVGAITACLLRGLGRVRSLCRETRPLRCAAWRADLDAVRQRLRIRRAVQLRVGHAIRSPLTGGFRRPVILLPASARDWSPEQRRLVLAHELVHVRRGDALRQLATRLAVALYWFQPLVWIAARLAVLAREQACDDEVLELGHRPSSYARLLLDLSEARPVPALALGMTEPPHLEKRLMAILAKNRRARTAGLPLLVALSMSVLVVSIAAAAPQAPPAPPAPPSGAVPLAPVAPTGGPPAPAPTAAPPSTSAPAAAAPGFRPAVSSTVAPPASTTASGQQDVPMSCNVAGLSGRFSGSLSTWTRDGTERYEMVGFHDGDHLVQKYVDGLRLCLRIHGPVEMSEDGRAIEGMLGGGWVLFEAENARTLQRLAITSDGNGLQHDFSVNGAHGAFDAAAQAWRDAMLDVLAGYWEVGRIRGEVSSLRGEISSIRGARSSLRGRISSVRGHVSSLRGQISSARGHVSSLRGQISSARGHVSSLRGQISSVRGHESSLRGRISSMKARASSLRSAARSTRDEETRARLEEERATVEESIRAVEREIEAWDTAGKVAAIERQIEAYDLEQRIAAIERQIEDRGVDGRVREIENEIAAYDADGKVAEIEREIEALDVEGKVAEIEARIEALNADERVEAVEQRLEPALTNLRRLIDRAR